MRPDKEEGHGWRFILKVFIHIYLSDRTGAVFLWHYKESKCFVHRSRRPWSRRNRPGSSGCPTRWSSSSLPWPLRAESKAAAGPQDWHWLPTKVTAGAGSANRTWELWSSTAEFLPWWHHLTASRPKQRLCLQSWSCHMEGRAAEKEPTWLVFIYFCSLLRETFFWQEMVFCVCMSVRLQRAEELCRTVKANGEVDLFSILWENSSEAEIEIYLTLREANLMWDGSVGSQIPQTLFLYLYICRLSVAG